MIRLSQQSRLSRRGLKGTSKILIPKYLNGLLYQQTQLLQRLRKRLMVGQMACKQERMHMQNQRRYLNRQNEGVPNLAFLLLLFIIILVIPISCISCQQNKRVVPISKHNDSIHAKIPNDTSLIHSDTSLEGKIFHIDNTVTIDSITHLPDTNKIFVFRDEKKIQTIIYKYH